MLNKTLLNKFLISSFLIGSVGMVTGCSDNQSPELPTDSDWIESPGNQEEMAPPSSPDDISRDG